MNHTVVAAHVLEALARANSEERPMNLDLLATEVRVRRADVRRVLSALHREGYVDCLRMRLTLAGFAVGRSLLTTSLPTLRATTAKASTASSAA